MYKEEYERSELEIIMLRTENVITESVPKQEQDELPIRGGN